MYASSGPLTGSVVLSVDYKLKYGKKGPFLGTVSALMRLLTGVLVHFRHLEWTFSALQFAEKT